MYVGVCVCMYVCMYVCIVVDSYEIVPNGNFFDLFLSLPYFVSMKYTP